MCVDLFTGETCFYKYGAAPSYVKSGKSIRRIKCETLAAGISMGAGIAPDTVRMRLRPGSTAVIATDGVIVDAEDEWLKQLLNKGFDDMKALARATLKEAESRYGAACCAPARNAVQRRGAFPCAVFGSGRGEPPCAAREHAPCDRY